MEPANKSSVTALDPTEIEFLPDADEIERRPLPPYARITIHALAAMMVAFLVWAAYAEIDEVVKAQGRLTTPSANIVVQPLETSIIRSIDVRIGQVVKKGERLATLDPTDADADNAQLRLKFDSLDTQVSAWRRNWQARPRRWARARPAPTRCCRTSWPASAAPTSMRRWRAWSRTSPRAAPRWKPICATSRRWASAPSRCAKSRRCRNAWSTRIRCQVNLLDARNKRMEVSATIT